MPGLIDTTLREGAQTPGVLFTLAQKISIAEAVAAIGIEELELGVVTGLDPELPALIRACREFSRCPRLALWCRCREEDIRLAARLAPDILSLSLPASERHIEKRLGKTKEWVLATLKESARLALDLGIKALSLGVEDASRADQAFVAELIDTAVAAGVSRIRLADTVGVLTPSKTSALVSACRERHPGVEFAFHGHNDFGLASANALSALESGAAWADVTVLGLGERAGCARLEELAGMMTLVNHDKAYRVEGLAGLCRLVAEASGRPISANHPLVGSAIFTCETGLHVHGLLADPASYEPFAPERLKAHRTILLGAKSGGQAVAGYCAKLGLTPAATALPSLVRHIRAQALELGRPLQEAEIRCLV
jgi:homocitrate synthase NifV